MKKKLWCWVCLKCGFRWIVTPRVMPKQCPSKACRSRAWNGEKKAGRPRKAVLESKNGLRGVNIAGELVGT